MKELTLFDTNTTTLMGYIHHEGEMISLTDLWKANGSIREKAPNFWVNSDTATQLCETVANILNASLNCILKSKRGKGGGTWAHKQIALAYAKYLDPKLHVLVNQVFFERIKEEKNPDLIADRYRATYKRMGKSDEWIDARFKGIAARNNFTHVLKEHEVHGHGYSKCTNAIYKGVFNADANGIKEKLELAPTANIRDNLTPLQISAVEFIENLASDFIKRNNVNGNNKCKKVCQNASESLRKSVDHFKYITKYGIELEQAAGLQPQS